MRRKIINIIKLAIRKFHSLGNFHVRVFNDEKKSNIDFLVGPFFNNYYSLKFAEKYLEKYLDVPLNCTILNKKKLSSYTHLPKFQKERINYIDFNEKLLNLHKKEFLLGQVLKYIKDDSVVVDIGANKGLYSSAFAQNAKVVYAFEVSDPVLVQLKKTAKKFKNIKIVKKAASDKSINSPFYIDENRFSNSGLVKQVNGPIKEVECIKLDDYFLKKDFKIDFVKIDTEGTELNVLKGMKKIIDKFRPYIMIECWGKQSSYNHEEIYSFFNKRNYICYTNIRGCGMVDLGSVNTFLNISKFNKFENITDCDFFFSPNRLW